MWQRRPGPVRPDAVNRYLAIVEDLARRVADGELVPGSPVPSVRRTAAMHATTGATASRAFAALARAGIIETRARQTSRVAPSGAIAARRLLSGTTSLRLAGSDDPALDLLLADTGNSVDVVGPRGSASGLAALWRSAADAAAIHLWHVEGAYNDPYARRLLHDRRPIIARLWRREQGIVLPPGNPEGIRDVRDLPRTVFAHRAPGTGTRTTVERLLRDHGVTPTSVAGPEAPSHLAVALAVAAGDATAGMAVRSAAETLGLDFVPVVWEPFEIALPDSGLPALEPLLHALGEPGTLARLAALAGYDLEGAGRVRRVT